ncbi:unnamed protein product [Lasius platythorax]|uniref:Secreted protein n=1 Tax=Lasius platythorax TaxID=488582 RepID=A0AAV2NKB9_9HYME
MSFYNRRRFRLLCLEPTMRRLLLRFVGVANKGVLHGPVCGFDEQEMQNSMEQPCLEQVPTFFSLSTWQGNLHLGHGRRYSPFASVRLA